MLPATVLSCGECLPVTPAWQADRCRYSEMLDLWRGHERRFDEVVVTLQKIFVLIPKTQTEMFLLTLYNIIRLFICTPINIPQLLKSKTHTLSNRMDLILKGKEHRRGWWQTHMHAQIHRSPTDSDNKQWLACEKQHRQGGSKQMPVPLLAMLISLLPQYLCFARSLCLSKRNPRPPCKNPNSSQKSNPPSFTQKTNKH